MIDSILTPLDGTPSAEAGLKWSRQAAATCGADIHLLTVVDPDQPGEGATLADAEAYLTVRRESMEADGLSSSSEVVVGEPAEQILRRSATAGLTVMTYGTSRWLFGAALDAVLRNIDRPLLVVRALGGETKAGGADGKLLVPLDKSAQSTEAVEEARRLARALGASIVLCHIVEAVGPHLSPESAPPGLAGIIEERLAEARSFLSVVARDVQAAGEPVETVVGMGEPPHEIARLADRAGASAIAMATRGTGSLSRVMGSVAYAVLLSGRLPCLLVRPNGAA
jgi:nucleotide-binding universal stress UspA family protein